MDQSSPDYVSRRGSDHSLQRVFRFSISCFVPEIFAIEVRSRPKSRQKSMFFGPNFFGGQDPQILDLIFKISPISHHVTKFRGDRPRDRDLALRKKINSSKTCARALRDRNGRLCPSVCPVRARNSKKNAERSKSVYTFPTAAVSGVPVLS